MSGMTARARVEELVDWLVRPANSFSKNMPRVLAAPDLAVDGLYRAMRTSWEKRFAANPEAFSVWFAEMAKEFASAQISERENFERASAFVMSDYAAAKLWPLMLRAHVAFPNSPVGVIPNPVGWGRAVLSASAALYAAETTSGPTETRGRAQLAAFAAVADGIYLTYLAKLSLLTQLAGGHAPKAPPRDLGRLCSQVAAAVDEADIVQADAAHIRNAIAHRHMRHLGRGRFLLWEKIRLDGSQWEQQVTAEEILARAQSMHQMACGLATALNAFSSIATWPIFEPMSHQLPALLLGQLTPEEIRCLSAEYDKRVANAFQSIPRELWDLRCAGEDPKLAELPE